MSVSNIGKRMVRVVDSMSSASSLPKIVAGLGVAISIVKLIAAVSDFKAAKSATGKIGFGFDNSDD